MADRYLRQTTSGHIYIWAPQFAARDDMVEVVRTKGGQFMPLLGGSSAPDTKAEKKAAINSDGGD